MQILKENMQILKKNYLNYNDQSVEVDGAEERGADAAEIADAQIEQGDALRRR